MLRYEDKNVCQGCLFYRPVNNKALFILSVNIGHSSWECIDQVNGESIQNDFVCSI